MHDQIARIGTSENAVSAKPFLLRLGNRLLEDSGTLEKFRPDIFLYNYYSIGNLLKRELRVGGTSVDVIYEQFLTGISVGISENNILIQ